MTRFLTFPFFLQQGKLSGADMVIYLLEKSRLTYQQPLERCYHAFYNIMSDHVPGDEAKETFSSFLLFARSQGQVLLER